MTDRIAPVPDFDPAAHLAALERGLGLVIASRQAEAMGGELALRNGPDGGAQAVLTLRPAPGPPSASVSDDPSIDRPASSGPAAPAP